MEVCTPRLTAADKVKALPTSEARSIDQVHHPTDINVAGMMACIQLQPQ